MSFQTISSIAIAGATGDLGTHFTNAFLRIPKLKSQFSKIIVFSRRRSSKTDHWEEQGVEIRILKEETEEECRRCLAGVDVLINAIGSKGDSLRMTLLHSIIGTGVKLYFPSEFGVDHTLHDFPMPEWDSKKQHLKTARSLFPSGSQTKVIRIFIGLFMHDGLGSWYGLDTQENKFSVVGDPQSFVSYTDLDDVAQVIGILVKKYKKDGPDGILDDLRIAGCTKSINEVARIMEKAQRLQSNKESKISFEVLNGPKFKKETLNKNSSDAIRYLRFLMGDGSIDYRSKDQGGHGNDNESVNPGQKFFKWKTIEDLATETNGRPCA